MHFLGQLWVDEQWHTVRQQPYLHFDARRGQLNCIGVRPLSPCFLCDRTDRGGAVCLVYCTVEHRVLGHVVVGSSINGHTKEKKSPRTTRSSIRLRARILHLRNGRQRHRKTAKNKVGSTYLCVSQTFCGVYVPTVYFVSVNTRWLCFQH